jgi:hypothetical protein
VAELGGGRRGFILERNILEGVIFVIINSYFDSFKFVVWLYINY